MHFYLPVLLLFSSVFIFAQGDSPPGTILLNNPSFEDDPRVGDAPRGWTDCGFIGESPVDIQPDPKREFEVYKTAQHGNTYLGMVTRDNDSHERVGQFLSEPLRAGQCYEFRIQLARSDSYVSQSRKTNRVANYITPIRLRVRGGFGRCDLGEVLGQSPLVDHYEWREYRFKLRPERDYTYIMLQAYYNTPMLMAYNGNILLDNVQPIRPIACDADLDAPPAPETEDEVTASAPPPSRQPARPGRPTAAPTGNHRPAPSAPTVRLGESEGRLAVGETFNLRNVKFRANSAVIEPSSVETLQEVVNFLQSYHNVVVEVGGHASNRAGPLYANRISRERATAVVDYLVSQYVDPTQIVPHGYGKTRQICQGDSDRCHEENQRVEIKILHIRESR